MIGKNIDELLEIRQICQYFPPSKFCAVRYIIYISADIDTNTNTDLYVVFSLIKPIAQTYVYTLKYHKIAVEMLTFSFVIFSHRLMDTERKEG